jgi:hypothetical protein
MMIMTEYQDSAAQMSPPAGHDLDEPDFAEEHTPSATDPTNASEGKRLEDRETDDPAEL